MKAGGLNNNSRTKRGEMFIRCKGKPCAKVDFSIVTLPADASVREVVLDYIPSSTPTNVEKRYYVLS